MKQWYVALFENYASNYDKEPFTQGTLSEVDFIEKELGYDKQKTILDIGCGTGRHSIELAVRGYTAVGIDLSPAQLRRAKEKAEEQNVSVTFYQQDARTIEFVNGFDMVTMICEGAFPLMETDEMNYQILKNAYNALKPGGKLLLTTLNALFPLTNSVKEFVNKGSSAVTSQTNNFDFLTFRDHSIVTIEDDNGIKKEIECNERYYVPSEISWYLKTLNFGAIDIYGCKIGEFSREKALTPQDFEMLVIAEK